MYVAQIQTAAGPLAIGLTDITREQINATFSALLEMLSQVTQPIVITDTDVYIAEAQGDTPAHMVFKYLGTSSETFAGPEAYTAAMNKHLAINVFACATDLKVDDAGKIAATFESFELVGEVPGATPGATFH